MLSLILFVFFGNSCKTGTSTSNQNDENTPDTIRLFYLGGQSNMEGYGYVSDLPDSLNKSFENVWIFDSNPASDNDTTGGLGIWAKLQPGYGTDFVSDGSVNRYSNRFGPELPFGAALAQRFPGQKIALVKYSRGGSSLQGKASPWGTWNPDFSEGNGLNQYDFFLKTVGNAMKVTDFDGDGRNDVLVPAGIVWMQGEGDASHTLETARAYKANLKQMMGLMRAAFRNRNLPIVIGLISDSGMDKDGNMMDYLEIVQQAQREFVAETPNSVLVDATQGYSFIQDGWHFTSKDYIDLGNKFADAVVRLEQKNKIKKNKF